MGQILTHGIYLPEEGERNCYDGLASNWSILDGAVGTVAEHTTQIAGKAPLVHTHTKSNITDFPAYGNTAGTICEGNDSRLSDARTPVAHTHTKADVTDLLNSNFIPSANNSYDLGSSSYQWNNLYAKNYYYNGVAWGLDKANTWTAQQKIVGSNSRGTISIYNPAYTKGGTLSVTDLSIGSIYMGDGGQQGLANSLSFISTDLASNGARTLLSLSTIENTASSGARTNVVVQYDKNDSENPRKVTIQGAVLPYVDVTFPLGTPTFRWKSFNGIDPGALSLPDYDRFEPIDFSQWDVNLGFGNTYTPSEDGWLHGEIVDSATNSIYLYAAGLQPVQNVYRKYGVSAQGNGSQNSSVGRLAVMMPVRKNVQYRFMIKASSVNEIFAIIFYPCVGNV